MMYLGYMYVAKIGDAAKVGFSYRPRVRMHNLESAFRCKIELIGVKKAIQRDETQFHIRNIDFAVASEIYPLDSIPIMKIMGELEPYVVEPRRAYKRKRPRLNFPFLDAMEKARSALERQKMRRNIGKRNRERAAS